MINIKEIFKTGLILFFVTAIAALLLAVVNMVTAPVIEQNQYNRTQEALKVVMSDAQEFSEVDVDDETIAGAYIAKDSSGEKMGVCVISTANGYGGEIEVLVGVSDGKVTGVQIMSHSETPGLGANATKPGFYEQYTGKSSGIAAVKQNPSDNEIQAMSGATITSKAVTEAVNYAIDFANSYMGGDK